MCRTGRRRSFVLTPRPAGAVLRRRIPLRRRGPTPKHRPRRLSIPDRPPRPGADLTALADFRYDGTHDGALLRPLHPGGH